ncbi:MAG: hypothetical protein COC23_06255 [Hyphomicrobiales bacterium]|nr:MAG: hypothetical protein COC23_06255 [Hyphomicrobiales bacterium]
MKHLLTAVGVAALLICTPASANEFSKQLKELATSKLMKIASDPNLVKQILAQNGQTAGYDQGKIDMLDKQWRAEVNAADKPLIDRTLANPTSKYLSGIQEKSEGLFTEIFAMDAKGLNVGQSTVTSDYWQGDEGKWQNTYSVGANAVDISEVEQDESTQTFQSQVSIPVLGEDGNPIGAITFGVNVEFL